MECWGIGKRCIFLSIESRNFIDTKEESSSLKLLGNNDKNKNEIRKVHDSEIEAVEIQKTNWIATSFLILIGALALTLIIFSIKWEGITFKNGGSL